MSTLAATLTTFAADTTAANNSIHSYLVPILGTLEGIAGLACTLALMYGGYLYMTSSGDTSRLDHAKRILRNAVIGLAIVLAAATVTAILHHAYSSPAPGSTDALPALKEIKPAEADEGWGAILIKALTGFFSNIITSLASPILDGLAKLTDGTPLMAAQGPVFNMWLVILGIANGLFVLVLALLGFRVMTGEMLGLGEIELRSLLPQIGLVFLLMNTSIFAIDAIIGLSNAIINAIYAGFPGTTIWKTLIDTMVQTSGLPLVSLMLFVAFIILACILVIYYIGRMIALFLGAALAPLVVLLWLLPGFRDFANNLIRTYLAVVFVLVVHVVILMLGSSLLKNEAVNLVPNPFMVTVVAIAILIALLKTQSVIIQMSLISSGANSTRKLGRQFANGMKYTADKFNAHAANELATERAKYAIPVLKAMK